MGGIANALSILINDNHFTDYCPSSYPLHLLPRFLAAALREPEEADLSWALVMASVTLVIEGAGVVVREGAALRLCCMWALTR
jgi:hypothetical protein